MSIKANFFSTEAAFTSHSTCREFRWPLKLGLPGGAWGSSSRALEDKTHALPNRYWSIVPPPTPHPTLTSFFVQELHYSKCVCFAVFPQTATANSLFHRLGGAAEAQRSDPLPDAMCCMDKWVPVFIAVIISWHAAGWWDTGSRQRMMEWHVIEKLMDITGQGRKPCLDGTLHEIL